MRASATTPAKDIYLEDPLRILSSNLPQLKAAWKKVDHSGFQPTLKHALVLAPLRHVLYKEFLQQNSSSETTAALASPSQPSSPRESQLSLPPSSPLRGTAQAAEERLAAAELVLEQHQHRLKEHQHRLRLYDQRAEELDQKARLLNLVLYNVPENEASSPLQESDEALAHIRQHMHEDSVQIKMQVTRLGKQLPDGRTRPIRLSFDSSGDKHHFLKHVRHLRQHGFNCDDDLTRLQQKQTHELSEDFQALKAKGQKPFFRGSQLKYNFADKTHTCRLGQAHKTPTAFPVVVKAPVSGKGTVDDTVTDFRKKMLAQWDEYQSGYQSGMRAMRASILP